MAHWEYRTSAYTIHTDLQQHQVTFAVQLSVLLWINAHINIHLDADTVLSERPSSCTAQLPGMPI